MANTTIRIKKSGVSGNVPGSLALGELAINYTDGLLYFANATGIRAFSANDSVAVNAVYSFANTINTYAYSAYAQANAAYNQANTSGSSTDAFARTQANSAFNQANAAFAKANTGSGSGLVYTANTTPPASGNNKGDQWYNTTTNVLYEWATDGTSYFWLDTSSPVYSNTANVNIITTGNVNTNVVFANSLYIGTQNANSYIQSYIQQNMISPLMFVGL